MPTFRLTALLLLAAAAPVLSERVQDPPAQVPETVIPRAAGPIVVDGDPGDAAWRQAPPLEFVFPWDDVSGGGAQSTVARMLYDDDALYLLYECVDPYLDAEVTEHDGPVYEEDAVEIFVTPNPADVSAYFGYEMNIRGVWLDYLAFGGGEHGTESIHFEWQAEGVLMGTSHDGTLNDHSDTDTGWVLEMAIPFDNFRHLGGRVPPEPGDEWRLNLNRTKGYEGQFSMWSDSHADEASFHHSAFFGRAFFGRRP